MIKQPLVSIGLPVYNGENFIAEALDSILNQSYKNLELIISDNASTDNTQSICEQYLKKDPRVQYHRFEKNFGAAKNYNRTFHLSKGKYFKWAAHDDVIAETYLEKCVEILESNQDISACHSHKLIIDEYGKKGNKVDYNQLHLMYDSVSKRYKGFLKKFDDSEGLRDADAVFGLIRSDILKNTKLIGNYHSSDFPLLGELILSGKFYVIKEDLFFRRLHPGISTQAFKSHKERRKWFDPQAKGFTIKSVPHLRWFIELFKAPIPLKMNLGLKLLCYFLTVRWFFARMSFSVMYRIKASSR